MKKIIYSLLYQIITIIISVLTSYYLARVLTVSQIGTYNYTTSIVMYWILFGTLGINLFAKREIAFYQNKKEIRSNIFWNIFLIRIMLIFISSILYYFILINNNNLSNYYKILFLQYLCTIIEIDWFYEAIEKFKIIFLRNILIKIINLICIFIFVKSSKDINNVLIIYVVSFFINNIILILDVHHHINKIDMKKIEIKNNIKRIFAYFLPQILLQLYTIIDKIFLVKITKNMIEVGFYTEAQIIMGTLTTLITSLNIIILPELAKHHSNGNKSEIKKCIIKSLYFVSIIGFPLSFGLLAFSKDIVILYLGKKFIKTALLIKIQSVIILVTGIGNIIGSQYLLASKNEKKFSLSIAAGLLTNIISNILLIKYKSVGTSISLVISQIIILFFEFYYTKEIINIRTIIEISKKYLISSIITFTIICTLNINIITKIIISIIIYFILLILQKDEYFYKTIKRKEKMILKNHL